MVKALRHLGFTVFDWEEQTFLFLDHWVDVYQNGSKPDVKRVYQNVDAAVDNPGNFFWEEILEAFPDCKVIVSERDEDSWVESLANQYGILEANKSRILIGLVFTNGKEDVLHRGFSPRCYAWISW